MPRLRTIERPTAAGLLLEKIKLQKRSTVADGYGNQRGGFTDQFTVGARIQPRFAGETVLAARLTGRNVANIVVRSSANTRLIRPEWRIVDARTGDIWNIRSVISPSALYIEMLCEKGVEA